MSHCIALYQDYVQNNGSLLMSLQNLGYQTLHVDAAGILSGALDHVDVLIVPGGADLYYCEKLKGDGNRMIRAFVENGGGYLGICAGAYYGCAALDWNKGEIKGARELGFIDATANGPIFDLIEDHDINKSWYASTTLQWNDRTFQTLYAAGPLFDTNDPDVNVLARYTDLENAPAVIGKKIGKGSVVLSSPHIEVTSGTFAAGRYAHRNESHAYEMAVSQGLQGHDATQKEFFDFVLKTLIKGA